jgi:hypothetical protein
VIRRGIVFIRENPNGSAKMKARQPGSLNGTLGMRQGRAASWLASNQTKTHSFAAQLD